MEVTIKKNQIITSLIELMARRDEQGWAVYVDGCGNVDCLHDTHVSGIAGDWIEVIDVEGVLSYDVDGLTNYDDPGDCEKFAGWIIDWIDWRAIAEDMDAAQFNNVSVTVDK